MAKTGDHWRAFSLRRSFAASAGVILIVLVALLGGLADYRPVAVEGVTSPEHVAQYYSWLQDTMIMVFVGFGFLMTFLRKYGYSAVGLNYFMSALVMIEALLCIGAVHHYWHERAAAITIDLPLIIEAAFCAGSAMIAFGAVIGKTTPAELLWLLVIMVPLYSLNQHLVFNVIRGIDMGGSITIHAFGAYYGLAASLVISCRQSDYTSANPKNGSSYISDIFSMIGTLFLWLYWPSFNGALASVTPLAEGAKPDPLTSAQQYFCVVNTILSLLASCVATFVVSALLKNKFDIMQVQNATLAGGVAVGSAAALNLHPAGALTVGAIAGSLSTLGFGRLTPWLEAKTGLGDTCGIHNLHGCPGILGGLVAGFASFTAANAAAAPHGRAQLAWQLLALAATIGVAALGGAAAGWAVSRANPYSQLIDGAHLFDDGLVWQGVDLELSAQDNSVVGVPSVHGGTAYPTHCKAAGGKDVGVDQV